MNQPLVSVVVITYNSSKYIIDGLESVKAQTYPNIELIISDDCSTDNTVAICQKWLEKNAHFFSNTNLVRAPKNRGVAPNCNQGIHSAKGEWIKILAGDDRLHADGIEEYIKFVTSGSDINICYAKPTFIGENKDLIDREKDYYERGIFPYLRINSSKKQLRLITKRWFVPGPGIFFRKTLWAKVNGFDERYPFCEEYPFTYNIMASGEKIYFIEKELYDYNVRADSLCKTNNQQGKRNQADWYRYFLDTRSKKMLQNGYILSFIDEYLVLRRRYHINNNKHNYQLIIDTIFLYLSPLQLYRTAKKIITPLLAHQ